MPKAGFSLTRVLLLMGVLLSFAAAKAPADDFGYYQNGTQFQINYYGPSVPIPDNSVNGALIPFSFPSDGEPFLNLTGEEVVSRVSVSFDGVGPLTNDPNAGRNAGINHPWVSDLVVTLIAPSGERVVLLNRINQGQGGTNLSQVMLDDNAASSIQRAGAANAPFSGYWRPNSPLGVLAGEELGGQWGLFVQDLGLGDVGTVEGFTVHFDVFPGSSGTNLAPLAAFAAPDSDLTTASSLIDAFGFAFDQDGTVTSVEYSLVDWANEDAWTPVDEFDGAVWSINNLELSSGENTIFVRAIDNQGRPSAPVMRRVTFDPEFTAPPVVNVTFPAGQTGTISTQTSSILIEGTASATDTQITSVQARIDGGPWQDAANLTGNWARWEFDYQNVQLGPDGSLVEFRALDTQGAESEIVSRRILRVSDNIRPGITIVEPDGDRQIPTSQTTFDFNGTAIDIDGFLQLVEYRISTETTFETGFQPPIETRYHGSENFELIRNAHQHNARALARSFTREWIPAENDSGDWREWSFTAQELEEGLNVVEVRALDNEEQYSVRESRRITRGDFGAQTPTVLVTTPPTNLNIPASQSTQIFGGSVLPVDGSPEAQIVVLEYNRNSTGWVSISNDNNFQSWQTELLMIEGVTNVILFRARDASGRQSPTVRREITRPVDTRPRATVSITNPPTNVLLTPGTRRFTIRGTATPAQSPLRELQYRSAPTSGQLVLVPWTTHVPAEGQEDLSQWEIDYILPRELNVFQVRVIDEDGRPSNAVSRSINRQLERPVVSVLFPPPPTYMVPASRDFITVRGVVNLNVGGLQGVEWRTSTSGLFDGVPWTLSAPTAIIANGIEFAFEIPLETGTNVIQLRGLGSNDVRGDIVTQTILKLEAGPPEEMLVLTEFGDVWGARNVEGQLQTPVRYGPVGFQQNTATGHKTFGGDFTGNGLTDLVTVTEFNDMWIAENQGDETIAVPTRFGSGLQINEGVGSTVFSGDFTGDGLTDLLQILPNGSLRLARNTGSTLAASEAYGNPGILYSLSDGLYVMVGDMNGDGLPDLIQVDSLLGEIRVALNNGTGFDTAVVWGTPGFEHDPANSVGVHVGDFNGDGFADIVEIRDGGASVALSNPLGTGLEEPTFWGQLGFHSDTSRGKGWWVFVMDADGDRADDLVQINEFGEAWFAISDGATTFDVPPPLNAPLGYEHKPEGLWQVFPGRVVPAED